MRAFKLNSKPTRGFTLIELLAVVAIIGVLAAMMMAVCGRVRAAAAKSREVTAARFLMQAYLLWPTDNRGVLLPQADAQGTAVNEAGAAVGSMSASRWPHRLRPYLGDRFRETLYVNEQAAYYDTTVAAGAGFMQDYNLSLGTTFGMNGRFVGGDGALIMDRPVRRVSEATAPGKLIVFASANERSLADNSGYWKIEGPAYWSGGANLTEVPAQKSLDMAYGYVSYRWSGSAVVAYLDGHVDLKTCAALRDMRLWSDAAYRTDNASYVPALAF